MDDGADDHHVVHVLERPDPSPTDPDGHDSLTGLWRHVIAAATGEDDGPSVRHWPAAVLTADGTDGVPAVAVAGLNRATARTIGAALGLDVVTELTEQDRRLVPCGPGRASRARERNSYGWTDIGWDDLDRWHHAHRLAATSAGVGVADRARCRTCGSTHLTRISYGMPVAPPPPWVTLGGCVVIIGGDQPTASCPDCGGRA